MAFTDYLPLEGRGAVVLLEVSFNDFATIAYRWSDVSTPVTVIAPTVYYQGRIVKIGKLTRGLGFEHLVQCGNVELLLDNSDLVCDWMVDRATVASQVFRARFRLSLLVYDATENYSEVPTHFTKVLGTFKCLDFPSRDNANVRLQLADDMAGAYDSPLRAPTIREWRDDAGSTANNCPLSQLDYQPIPNIDWDVPVQLAFGLDPVVCFMADAIHESEVLSVGASASSVAMSQCRAIIVCATRSTAGVTTLDAKVLRGVYGSDVRLGSSPWSGAGSTLEIPKTWTSGPSGTQGPLAVSNTTYEIWTPQKTQVLTSDGVTWCITWVKLNVWNYVLWWTAHNAAVSVIKGGATSSGVSPALYGWPSAQIGPWFLPTLSQAAAAFSHFHVIGEPLSLVTNARPDGVTVLRDLFKYYSKAGAAAVDDASFDKALSTNSTIVQGTVVPTRVLPINAGRFEFRSDLPHPAVLSTGLLRKAVSEICQSIDVDIVLTWDGKVRCLGTWLNFTDLTATRVALKEEDCRDVIERIPSQGERFAPYNRMYVIAPDGSTHGPYLNQTAITAWGIAIDRTFEGKWLSKSPLQMSEWENTLWSLGPRLESTVRPVIQFAHDRVALQLEIGDLFEFTWSRGGSSGPYTSAVFRVESMTVALPGMEVQLGAVWVDDLLTSLPYLLDDETMPLVVASSAGRTATVTDGSISVVFSSGDLLADGVQGGDILWLLDSTQTANTFSRYRMLYVGDVLDAVTLTVDAETDLNFAAVLGQAVSTWKITKGAATYIDLVASSPTNYPSALAASLYGKASSDADVFLGGAAANKLLG